MSVISSESVFHFTKSINNLFGILKDEFRPNFCFEVCDLKDRPMKGAFPMISFCDIPLSQIKEHIGKYGPYGLGMTKNWAERAGLNPVLYIKKGSHLSAHIQGFMELMISGDKSTGELSNVERSLKSILRYFKPFEGDYLRGSRVPRIKFYGERELRYVPPPEKTQNRFLFLSEKQFRDKTIRNKWNLIMREIRVSFEPDDIKYIIIKDEDEVSMIAHELKEIKRKYSYETVEKLLTRIITSEQVMKDF